jgi:electron transport complex protein RnfB
MTAGDIDALLPQTQCTKCGYAGCLPYAEAIAAGAADINQCPPGGETGVRKLAALLGREPKPLDPAHGGERRRAVANIDETRCIGCTLCIKACPVDAIVGAPKLMHTVIAALCTGCDLCLPPCPVDCIDMRPVPDAQSAWTDAMAQAARARFHFRRLRLAREGMEHSERLSRKDREEIGPPSAKSAVILAAIARAKSRSAGGAAGRTRLPQSKAQMASAKEKP